MQRFVLWTALASVVLCGMMIASLQWGSVELSWRQVLSALGLASAPVAEIVKTIVIDLRLPRVLLAALTGAGLAIVFHHFYTVPVEQTAADYIQICSIQMFL